MPEKWTGELISDMHLNRVSREELSKELNCSYGYVIMVLNGQKTPKGGKDRFRAAFDAIVARRAENGPGV